MSTLAVPSAVTAPAPRRLEAPAQTWYMTQRQFMAFLRQPAYLIITLIQPVIWMFLFGALFHKVVELPGFGTGSYLDFLVPGVIVMSAVSVNMWAGMGTLEEIERGTLNRFLITPVRRSALMNANVVAQAVTTALQSVIIILLGLAGGARYPGGAAGLLVLIVAASVLGTVFGAFSNAIGMMVRQRESIIGINTFLLLPLTFLSSAFMAPGLMPHWMRVVARFNPVNWALEASRSAMAAHADWWSVLSHGGWLLLLAALAVTLSLRTFRSYQKSVCPGAPAGAPVARAWSSGRPVTRRVMLRRPAARPVAGSPVPGRILGTPW
jgi:ABC-2 type transport system permease protein